MVRGRVRDIVVREGRAAAVTTTVGELDADVVVCAVDPRGLPALAGLVRRTTVAIPAATTYVGLEGEVRDLPHELVIHGDQTLVLRTAGRAPTGHHAWSVQTRGRRQEDPLVALARHGLEVREQVVARVDRTPRDLVGALGRHSARSALAGPRDGAPTPGAAHPDRRRLRRGVARGPRLRAPLRRALGRAGRPGGGSGALTVGVASAQLEGHGHRGGHRLLAGLEARRRSWRRPWPAGAPRQRATLERRPAARPALRRPGGPDGCRARRRRRTPPRGPPSRRRRVGHLQRDPLDAQPLGDRRGQGSQQLTGGLDAGAADRQRVGGLEPRGHALLVVGRPDLDGRRPDPLRSGVLAGGGTTCRAALSAPASASATPAARWTAATRTTASRGRPGSRRGR